jgi:hypothetical protein
MRAKKAAHKR